MSAFEIRRFVPPNSGDALEMLDALLPEDRRDGPLPPEGDLAAAVADRRAILIGALWDGAAAGHASGFVTAGLIRAGDVAILDDLLAAPLFRGRGQALALRFREAALAVARRPMAMWSGTDQDNIACQRAFRASGGAPATPGVHFVEFAWPAQDQIGGTP